MHRAVRVVGLIVVGWFSTDAAAAQQPAAAMVADASWSFDAVPGASTLSGTAAYAGIPLTPKKVNRLHVFTDATGTAPVASCGCSTRRPAS